MLCGAVACGEAPRDTRLASPASNVVIICIDTLRHDHLSIADYKRETSPTVDRVAEAGLRFTNAYAHSPWTVPSTATLLTSRLPSAHGAGLAGDLDRNLSKTPPTQIEEASLSIATSLQGEGYRTGLFSANPFISGSFKRGFDVAQSTRQTASELTSSAIDWVEAAGATDGKFLLYLQYIDLHEPTSPPDEFSTLFPVSASAGPRTPEQERWRHSRLVDETDPNFLAFKEHKVALYDGALRYVDAQIARLLGRLEELGVREDTLVVVLSDHGEEFWDHASIQREQGGDPRDIWGIGHGHTMFDELLRVPLVIAGPGITAGNVQACDVGLIDVAPTILTYLGLKIPDSMNGSSLLVETPTRGRELQTRCPDKPILAESPAYGPDATAVIWKRHKLIERADGQSMVYALDEDPLERLPIASTNIQAGLSQLIAEHQRAGSAAGQTDGMEMDEEAMDELRSLGYLGGSTQKR